MRYDPHAVEPKWQTRWLKERTYEPDLNRAKRPFYNLMMFPYPSAEGLHVGNMYAFVGADIYGRFQRMRGFDVFEPIGLDGFGIHSENYALKINKHPADQAKVSEKNFYRQLKIIGNGFAWEERLKTYDPSYYRWTQWIFTEMFRRGLAYRKKSPVNWCPSCLTVLADEQVVNGACERCGTKVEKKDLEQWFFRITRYVERLLQNLEKIDWSEKIKVAQRNWIGKSEGAEIEFRIKDHEARVKVFTTRPDTLFGATYMVLGPEHPLIKELESRFENLEEVKRYVASAKKKTEADRIAGRKEKTGVELKGIKAINPANKEEMPVWVADYVLGHVGTGAIMAVPAHDQRDYEFALKFGLPIQEVIQPAGDSIQNSKFKIQNGNAKFKIEGQAYEGEGILVNSGRFDGTSSEEAKREIAKAVGGRRVAAYRLRDWLISRQRYWGPPIPLVFCENCKKRVENSKFKIQNSKFSKGELENPGWIAVPEEDLPVKLPYITNFRPTGTEKSPLTLVEKFYKVKCPKCKSWARRETDVSDTFLDSAWYYLGYLILGNQKSKIKNKKFALDSALIKRWLPVDMYIGGAEHAVLHLLYVRFLALAFHDGGMLHFEEPFKRFRAHGLLISGGAKMSKSRGNVVNPDDYIRAYGADALRMYLMFLGPFEQGGDFRDAGIRGITRFLEHVWRLLGSSGNIREGKYLPQAYERVEQQVQKTVAKVSHDIAHLHFNTAISALMILLNYFEADQQPVLRAHASILLRLLAPFAPHITEELWHSVLGEKTSIHRSHWPEADPRHLTEERITLVVQVNGRVRDRVDVKSGAAEAAVRALVLERPKVKEWLAGEPVRKFIYIPGRIVNIVV